MAPPNTTANNPSDTSKDEPEQDIVEQGWKRQALSHTETIKDLMKDLKELGAMQKKERAKELEQYKDLLSERNKVYRLEGKLEIERKENSHLVEQCNKLPPLRLEVKELKAELHEERIAKYLVQAELKRERTKREQIQAELEEELTKNGRLAKAVRDHEFILKYGGLKLQTLQRILDEVNKGEHACDCIWK